MKRPSAELRVPLAVEPTRFRAGAVGLLVFAIAVIEIIGHFVVRSRVVPEADWRAAATFVRAERREGDRVVVAPAWADPVLRVHFRDLISLRDAAAPDLDRYTRLWVVSIRGHRSPLEPRREPHLDRSFGAVRVRRFGLGPSRTLYDFVDHLAEAEVALEREGRSEPCRYQRRAPVGPGGLAAGPMWPAERFQCDASRPWLWVGETVLTDLELEPRRCIWQHPAGKEPIRTTFRDVPLGDRLVVHGGIHYYQERDLGRAPVRLVIRVDGEPIGEMIHRDGDGWKRIEARTPARAHGEVTFEVTANDPHLRTFCWSATVQDGERTSR